MSSAGGLQWQWQQQGGYDMTMTETMMTVIVATWQNDTAAGWLSSVPPALFTYANVYISMHAHTVVYTRMCM